MKKILYLLDHHIDSIGGSQKSTKTIVLEMLKSGNDVALFMTNDNKIDAAKSCSLTGKCKIYVMNERNNTSRISYVLKKMKFVKKIVEDYKPDIIHAQNPTGGAIIAIFKKFHMINKQIKCIYTDRGVFTDYTKSFQLIYRVLKNNWDCLITTTEINANIWKEHTNIKKVYSVPNVLDYDWFDYSSEQERTIKNKYNVKKTFNVGFAGRFVELKRWDTVLEICKILKKYDNISFLFAIASASEEGDENYFNKENEYFNQLEENLSGRYVLIKNADVIQMKEFYYMTDAFILTSSHESFGRTLLEAMTKNTLVFGTKVGGVPDVINNEEYLFDVGNAKQICELLERFINNQELTIQEKEKFMMYVEDNFKPSVLQDKLNKIYNEI